MNRLSELPPHDVDALAPWVDAAPPSWQSRVLNAVLRRLPLKRGTASAAAVRDYVRRRDARPPSHAPARLGSGVDVALAPAGGWPVYRVTPQGKAAPAKSVVFLHGGGYIKEIVPAHWRLIGEWVREAGVRCVVPIYPLAPRGRAADVVPATGRLLAGLLDEADAGEVIVAGNSAGAGLALAAAQWLRDAGHRQPEGLILISPGISALLDTPQRRAIAPADPLQDIPGILEAGRLYAGALELAHPYVSPLLGSMDGLAPMLVFCGTRDLLYPDSIALAQRARAAGVPVTLHLRHGQPHNYPALPTPEGRAARRAILRALIHGIHGIHGMHGIAGDER